MTLRPEQPSQGADVPEAVGRRDLSPAVVIEQEQSLTMVRHEGQSRRFAAIHLWRVVGRQSLVGRADRPLQQGQEAGTSGRGVSPRMISSPTADGTQISSANAFSSGSRPIFASKISGLASATTSNSRRSEVMRELVGRQIDHRHSDPAQRLGKIPDRQTRQLRGLAQRDAAQFEELGGEQETKLPLRVIGREAGGRQPLLIEGELKSHGSTLASR